MDSSDQLARNPVQNPHGTSEEISWCGLAIHVQHHSSKGMPNDGKPTATCFYPKKKEKKKKTTTIYHAHCLLAWIDLASYHGQVRCESRFLWHYHFDITLQPKLCPLPAVMTCATMECTIQQACWFEL